MIIQNQPVGAIKKTRTTNNSQPLNRVVGLFILSGIDMTYAKQLSFKLRDGRFGDGVHYSVTQPFYKVTLNDLSRLTDKPCLWAVTMWVDNLKSGEVCTLDFIMSIYYTYEQIKYFLSPVLEDYVNNFHNELDFDDLSGKTWTASISVRTLTRRETEQLILQGAEIFPGPQQGETFEIRYDGELQENEVCDFDWPLMNMKPDMDELMKIKKRK